MNDIFEGIIPIILKNEGGFQNDPDDKGNWVNGQLRGTKYGIAARYFPNIVNIKGLTVDQAKSIYYTKYWLPMNLIGIKDGMAALHIFDMGVNAGRKTAIKIAQNVVKAEPDGVCGKNTTEAINNYPNFVEAYKQARRDYYISLVRKYPRNAKFLKGWLNRIEKTKFT